mmetsp:Transcript_16042/g.40759  ORF Transcript_16042/g.40759 Transcript_16042/m.40759 type:complete len:227 (-) Transcript_16042:2291-2971(-)
MIQNSLRGMGQNGQVGLALRGGIQHDHSEIDVIAEAVQVDREHHHPPHPPPCAHVQHGAHLRAPHMLRHTSSQPGLHAHPTVHCHSTVSVRDIQRVQRVPLALSSFKTVHHLVARPLRQHRRRRHMPPKKLDVSLLHLPANRSSHRGQHRGLLRAVQEHHLEERVVGHVELAHGDPHCPGRLFVRDHQQQRPVVPRQRDHVPVGTGAHAARCSLVLDEGGELAAGR